MSNLRLVVVLLAVWGGGCSSSSGPVQSSDVKDVAGDLAGKDGTLDLVTDTLPECGTDLECQTLLGDIGPCRIAVCDATTKTCDARPTKDGTACDDDNACTDKGECSDGECLPGPNTCQCEVDADCTKHEDGNLCNGTLICQGNVCEVDPTTIPPCDLPAGETCKEAACQPESGECEVTSLADGSTCDDGDPCTQDDACTKGVCEGLEIKCDDQDACTDGDYCDQGECLPGSWICGEICGNVLCIAPETCASCPADCGVCPPACGDQSCNGTETCATCPGDCGKCGPVCPDTVCGAAETCSSCEADCGPCSSTCGNGVCTLDENCRNCPEECGACPETCGDGSCDPNESCGACEADCGPCPECGNQLCDPNETCGNCPSDCGACVGCGDGYCNPTEEDCLTCTADCGQCPVDCCVPGTTGACNQAYIKACVCQFLPECCTQLWTDQCVLAIEAKHCGYCPTVCGDNVCSSDEDCASCQADCGPCEVSCCWPQNAAGCGDNAVEDFVCIQNPSCCDSKWSQECLDLLYNGWPSYCCGDGQCSPGEACDLCPADCACAAVCGDGLCSGNTPIPETLDSCPQDCPPWTSHCCSQHPTAGCDDQSVAFDVCQVKPDCCTESWYPSCVELAASIRPDVCCGDGTCGLAEDCQNCVPDCGWCDDSCCISHPGPGCSDPLLAAVVCLTNPECCNQSWGDSCVLAAKGLSASACCGDAVCEGGETCELCASDCGLCLPPCGDGLCGLEAGEGCGNCPADCGVCPDDCCSPGEYARCGRPSVWEDVRLMMPKCQQQWTWECADFYSSMAPGACCGDGQCRVSEACNSCEQDCGPCVDTCGDGACTGVENCNGCPGDCGLCHDCCQPHGGYGCEDPNWAMCVCLQNPGCCEGVWTLECVLLGVQSGCGVCPNLCGNGVCDGSEYCGTCSADCGVCSFAGCLPKVEPGCDDPQVQSLVCQTLPECCTQAWSKACADLVELAFPWYCCGDGLCSNHEQFEFCEDCLFLTDCCQPHFGMGCVDPDVEQCVCEIDQECCMYGWTQKCVALAISSGCGSCLSTCGDGVCAGGETCSSCAADCGPCAGDCCQAGSGEGCAQGDLKQVACASDSSCCSGPWTQTCADLVGQLLPEACCGNGACEPFEDCAECAQDCGLCQGSCCAVQQGPECETPEINSYICAMDPYCCNMKWDDLCVMEVGREFPEFCCGDGLCGGADSCSQCPDDCGTCPKDCCQVQDGPGCPDAYLQACVCSFYPECCTQTWTAQCVIWGNAMGCLECKPQCGDGVCLPGEECVNCPSDCGSCSYDCCVAHPGGGCGDVEVQAAVCASLPFCCSVAWTDLCVEATEFFRQGYCCGDQVCSAGESCNGCTEDCGICEVVCGQNGCQAGETCDNCPEDCGACNGSDCGQLLQCLQLCQSGECTDLCFNQAPPEAIALYTGVVDCVIGICPQPTEECIDQALFGPCFEKYSQCVDCHPSCAGRECGSDGCNGSCGQCGTDEYCSDQGSCVYQVCGDGVCDPAQENCEECVEDCGVCPTDCCATQPNGGCVDPNLAYLVCQTLPQCCLLSWGEECVAKVHELLPDFCCGNGYCSPDEECLCKEDCTCPQELTCAEAIDCATLCNGDFNCVAQCGAQIPVEAQNRFYPLANCVWAVCPNLDIQCFFQAAQMVCIKDYESCLLCDTQCGGRECGTNGCGGSCGTCAPGGQCSPQGLCVVPVCGDQVCDGNYYEDCVTCPADCGQCAELDCMGIMMCAQTCGDPACIDACTASGTPEAQQLFSTLLLCVMTACGGNPTPQCLNGPASIACAAQFDQCAACIPQCTNKQCGDDGCGSVCGTCGESTLCSSAGACISPWGCGDGFCLGLDESCDTCPGDCGACEYVNCDSAVVALVSCQGNAICEDQARRQTPAAVWNKSLPVHDCVWDACPMYDLNCALNSLYGTCFSLYAQCACLPSCVNKVCGEDGCGGSCGACPQHTTCTSWGTCGAGCGDGSCDNGETCKICPQDCGPCADDCCTAHASPLCNDGSVAACLCFGHDMMQCCTDVWSQECVDQAVNFGCLQCN